MIARAGIWSFTNMILAGVLPRDPMSRLPFCFLTSISGKERNAKMYQSFVHLVQEIEPPYILLIQASIAVALPYVLWRVCRLERWLPLIVVQIFAGVLLGPSHTPKRGQRWAWEPNKENRKAAIFCLLA